MDIRNIQKTGDMHYIYLPTHWCRQHKISAKSKVGMEQSAEGNIVIYPQTTEKNQKHLKFTVSGDDEPALNKLIVASYINPAAGFEINLDKELDFTKLLQQKRLISLEAVEIDKKQITCDGSVHVVDPKSLLKTMVKKIKNLLIVMQKNHNEELIERYEDEMDRAKLLIDKAVIGSLSFERTTKVKNIELYYIALIAKDLERMVDHVITLKPTERSFIDQITTPIDTLLSILEDTSKLDQKTAFLFTKQVEALPSELKSLKNYSFRRIRSTLNTISEVIMDWMVTLHLEN